MHVSCDHTFAIMAYKDSPYLKESIASLKKQTIQSRIIITTSTPSPFLKDISTEYNIDLFVNSSGGSIGSDWSFAYKNCRSQYLTLAHQDDIYMPGYLESCLAAVKDDTRSLLIFTDYVELREGKIYGANLSGFVKKVILSGFRFKRNIHAPLLKKALLYLGSPIACPSAMYNKNNIGDFEFSRDLQCALDWEAWLRLAMLEGSFTYVNKKLIAHRLYENSQAYLQTENKRRMREEEEIFAGLWPRAVARVLAHIHYLASKS